MIWPLLKLLGQKLSNYFVGILVETMTPQGHFEINWPLAHANSADKIQSKNYEGSKSTLPHAN